LKIRQGFVSNSSSSSFMVFNPPTINNMSDLTKYLKIEPNIETEKDFDKMLSLFQIQENQKFTKKEIIKLLANAIQDGNIPFFKKLFEEKITEEYESSVMQFLFAFDVYGEKYKEAENVLLNPLVMTFVNYMGMFTPTILIDICNEHESYKTDEDKTKAHIKWDRQCKSITKIYQILAKNVYEKLKEEKLLESLSVFEVADDEYPKIEQGHYFVNIENIVSISNH